MAQSPNEARALRPRARLLRTLGEELISSEAVAILELVKNSYDADACYVSIEFFKSLQQGDGGVEIRDDGHGMDLTIVHSAWMEPATANKKRAKESRYLHRRMLGEKGIGRFASARLAEELELITRAANQETEVYAIFDWTQFDSDEKFLDEILILAEERPPKIFVKEQKRELSQPRINKDDLPRDGTHGTILRMSKLKKTWDTKEIEELKRALGRLVSPFDQASDFKIYLRMPGDLAGFQQEISAPEVLKYPHYELEGKVEASGTALIRITLFGVSEIPQVLTGKFLRASESDNEIVFIENANELPEGAPIECGPLDFKLLIWDRDQLESIDQKLGYGLKAIRRDLDSIAGISIFRDGFRVLPYGEPENDWLRLDLRRVQNPSMRLSNNQLTGYIRIGADTNPALRDQSNREGLNNNQAFADLQSIILIAMSRLESLRFSAKKAERSAAEPPHDGLLSPPDVEELRLKLSKLKASTQTIQLFESAAKRWQNQVVRVREVLSRYHSLATLGQLIDKVVHDSRQPLSALNGQTSLVREIISNWLEDNSPTSPCGQIVSSIDRRLQKIQDSAALLDAVLTRIEPLGGKRKARGSKLYLQEIIRRAFTYFEGDIKAQNIRVTLPAGDNLLSVDSSEIEQVLINLISNSVYWLAQVPRTKREIVVDCSRKRTGEVEIVFADSGPGIARKNRDAIFEPYFSTKPSGIGLGLVIAGEVIRDFYGGTLELLNSGPLKGAVFRITLRQRIH